MKRIAISELEGAALDWAVARHAGKGKPWIGKTKVFVGGFKTIYQPTKNWSQCGPLIERYRVGVEWSGDDIYVYSQELPLRVFIGRSLLELACRAIVANHNPSGYVEVPDELVEES